MGKRWRFLGLGALCVGLAALGLSALGLRGSSRATFAVDPPAAVRSAVDEALSLRLAGPTDATWWAGSQSTWRASERYRVFFRAPSEGGLADIFRADVRVDAAGRVAVDDPMPVTRTPDGDEGNPVIRDGWLAFGTRVGGRFQSVTCLPLDRLERGDVYALTVPAETLELSWLIPVGSDAVLSVRASSEWLLDAATHRIVQGEGGIAFQPAVRGEQAWLPNLVSRVRELPFVGPEKIAFLENVVFSVRDWVNQRLHRGATPETPVAVQAETATPLAPLPTQRPTEESSVIPPTDPAPTTDMGTAAPTRTATHAPTLAPSATATPPFASPETPLADGVAHLGSLHPDPKRPYASVEVVGIDPSLLQLKMVPGTHEPRPSTGLVGSGVILQSDWPSLVAGFNGGFAAMHGGYGMMVDRKIYLPPRDGLATVAVYEDGSIRMGTWGKDFAQTADMVSFRQNCPPLIENGTITAETGKLTLWGLSVSNELYLYRSGLGVNRDGRLLYVAGKPLSAYTLAVALHQAGAVYGMQLDVDEYHVAFLTYDVRPGSGGAAPTVTAKKLKSDMLGFDGWFLRPFQLDFFYLVRRPQPLALAVRTPAPTRAPVAAPTLQVRDLPGTIAFASNPEGRWQLYTIKPGQPTSLRPLTQSAADDLYPAWSPDGKRLAFASRRTVDMEIHVLDLASGQVTQVTHQPSEEWAPNWSPDGARLLYQSDRNGQSDIYVCALDGSGETRLTPMEGNHEAPSWSPDGRTIAFDSDLDVKELVSNSINLYYMDADGSNPRRILPWAESPVWSPDGQSIAFLLRQVYWQVFVTSASGSGLRQLTFGAYDSRSPAWSPDGRWIASSGKESGHWELYAVPVSGGDPVRLTFGTADCSYPSWTN